MEEQGAPRRHGGMKKSGCVACAEPPDFARSKLLIQRCSTKRLGSLAIVNFTDWLIAGAVSSVAY